ncbi:MAG: A/G-specific adenine glycosylase [Alphaproteobacteria bacterium]|nr:A/G-specific adenine glycosylase [Alphaproteobacteria bacterium]
MSDTKTNGRIDVDPVAFADRLLIWYDRHRRAMPWRALPGEAPDPYRVWLSEIMLQQTNVATVVPYFTRFVERWPTVADLAGADLDEVLTAWAGLGYYVRAHSLHKCAQVVAAGRNGGFPVDPAALMTLPGIGPYSAAAIAAIAFGQRAAAVDGNVERVIARVYAVEDPLPGVKARLAALAGDLVPAGRSGDYAQALMDLGATVCTPRNPACTICPLVPWCRGCRQGCAADLPRRAVKAPRPIRHGIAFWIMRRDGAVLLRRRPGEGLLRGMMEIPSTPWRDTAWALEEAALEAPLPLTWRSLPGVVRHPFTHFHLELTLATAKAGVRADVRGVWVPLAKLEEHALPSVMRKVVSHALHRAY